MIDTTILFWILLSAGAMTFCLGFTKWAYKNDYEDTLFAIGIILFVFGSWIIPSIYYEATQRISIDEEADAYCKDYGYDSFDDWKGYGVWPREPAIIRCKYYDNSAHVSGGLKIDG